MFFFEKKNQKTFNFELFGARTCPPKNNERSFFASFCSQKEGLPFLFPPAKTPWRGRVRWIEFLAMTDLATSFRAILTGLRAAIAAHA
ncbi:MAG: hypothetical protein IT555_18895, partial [Acetobacteraceae bacterium]|nr:hypothetical protein [Acetobacteraceae bacterium]